MMRRKPTQNVDPNINASRNLHFTGKSYTARPSGPPIEIPRTTRASESGKPIPKHPRERILRNKPPARAIQELPSSTRIVGGITTSTKKDISSYERDLRSKIPPQKKEGPPHGVLWIEKKSHGAQPSLNYEGSIIGEEREDRFLYYKKAVDEEHAKKLQGELGKYGVKADAFRKQRVNRMKRKPVTRKPISKVTIKKKVVKRRR